MNESSNYTCEACDYQTINAHNFLLHTQTLKHAKTMKATASDPLLCTVCEKYQTRDKSHFIRHVKTCIKRKQEHKDKLAAAQQQAPQTALAVPEQPVFTMSQMERIVEKVGEVQVAAMQPLVERLESLEHLETIVTEIKKSVGQLSTTVINGNGNNINNGTIHDNRTMNINMFLNEHCKDAMNIMDFIRQLPISPHDLDKFAKLGYANAMSDIMISELNNMPLTQRPLHCTDVRRHTLHIKHEDAWHREGHTTPILLTAIKTLRQLCSNLAHERFEHSDKLEPNTPSDYMYQKIMQEVTGGRDTHRRGQTYERRNMKIMTTICKAVKLTKEQIV